MLRRSLFVLSLVATSAFGRVALAQDAPPPLPPPAPPPPGSQPASAPEYTAPPASAPQPAPARPAPPPPRSEPVREPPARVEYVEPEMPTHAPKYSLYTGLRASYVGFGNAFFRNELGGSETTGAYVGNGLSLQLDVGARISRRYMPYVFFEHGFMSQGRRFEGSNASSSTEYMGIGFRYVSGDVDEVGFLTDIAIGKRSVTVKDGSQSYTMSGLEFFRLGLGAEIRITTLFSVSPMGFVSLGALTDTTGNIRYSPQGSADGLTSPRFANGRLLEENLNYVVLGIGAGGHFDIFGK